MSAARKEAACFADAMAAHDREWRALNTRLDAALAAWDEAEAACHVAHIAAIKELRAALQQEVKP